MVSITDIVAVNVLILFHLGIACILIFGLSYVSRSSFRLRACLDSVIWLKLVQRPFMAAYGPYALVWELSTPFLNSKLFACQVSANITLPEAPIPVFSPCEPES
jgi:hypothetical protein